MERCSIKFDESGDGGHVFECWTVSRGDSGTVQPVAVFKPGQF